MTAVNPTITAAIANRFVLPAGHVCAIAHARVFGPNVHRTPSGHPVLLSTPPFDNSVQTAVNAIAAAALKWYGITIVESDWELDLEEDVIDHPGTKKVLYSKVYHFKYTPEAAMWATLGLSDTNVPNHFKSSWYLTSSWKSTPITLGNAHITRAGK